MKQFIDEKAGENQRRVAIPLLRPAEGRVNDSGKKVTLVPVKKLKARGK